MGGLTFAALGQGAAALAESTKDIKPFASRDCSFFYMLHGTLTDAPIATTASTTYTSLTRPFAASKQLKFYLQSSNNGAFTAFYSVDGVTFVSQLVTGKQDGTKFVYELTVPGPVISAYYRYVETAAAGAIFGGFSSLESVVE